MGDFKPPKTPEELKNWDKLTVSQQDGVRHWFKITTVTINDDGLYMLDIIPYPATPNAYLRKNENDGKTKNS